MSNTYAAMAHKGRMSGQTFEVKADTLLDAKREAVRIAGIKGKYPMNDVSVQLQQRADGTEVIGAIM